jgi:response regulator of citrate/malate metabolism
VIRTLVVDDDYHVAHAHALSVGRLPGFSVAGDAHSAEEARGGANVPAARISASIWAGEYR